MLSSSKARAVSACLLRSIKQSVSELVSASGARMRSDVVGSHYDQKQDVMLKSVKLNPV